VGGVIKGESNRVKVKDAIVNALLK